MNLMVAADSIVVLIHQLLPTMVEPEEGEGSEADNFGVVGNFYDQNP